MTYRGRAELPHSAPRSAADRAGAERPGAEHTGAERTGADPADGDPANAWRGTPSGDAESQIAQLLDDAVNHLLSAGFELASVRARLPALDEQGLLEHACDNLDAALVDIRRFAVSVTRAKQASG